MPCPASGGFATSRCYHDRGCGTASPRLTNPTMPFPLRGPHLGRMGATPPPVWRCYRRAHIQLPQCGSHPLSISSVQESKIARRLHAAARCTLPHLVDLHSALPEAQSLFSIGSSIAESQYKTDYRPALLASSQQQQANPEIVPSPVVNPQSTSVSLQALLAFVSHNPTYPEHPHYRVGILPWPQPVSCRKHPRQ